MTALSVNVDGTASRRGSDAQACSKTTTTSPEAIRASEKDFKVACLCKTQSRQRGAQYRIAILARLGIDYSQRGTRPGAPRYSARRETPSPNYRGGPILSRQALAAGVSEVLTRGRDFTGSAIASNSRTAPP
jgi:hypothetical protein